MAVVNRVQSVSQLQRDNSALQAALADAKAQLARLGADGGGAAVGERGGAAEGKAAAAAAAAEAAAPLAEEVERLKEALAAKEGELMQLQHEVEEEGQAAAPPRPCPPTPLSDPLAALSRCRRAAVC